MSPLFLLPINTYIINYILYEEIFKRYNCFDRGAESYY